MSSSSSPSSSSSSSSMTSVSSSSSSIHPASLVDASLHSPHTLRLVNIKITKHLIDHVVDEVIDTVDYAMGKASPSSSSSRGHNPKPRTALQSKFTTFATNVLTRAEITTPTLLATLIYISRARPFLHIALEEWALERVFLGALITASKYLNDSTLKNIHWALCTGVFGKRDVGRIEREFLAVLDWELGVTEGEVLGLWESLEWAVEVEEREERRLRERAERKLKERAQQAMLAAEQQQKKTSLFYISKESHSRSSSLESNASSSTTDSMPPPPVPPKGTRNHHRRSHPAPVHVIPHLTHSSSPTSSASSSSSSFSSSSSPRTPLTPADFELGYPEPEELERAKKQQQQQRPQLKHNAQYHIPVPSPVYAVEESMAMEVDAGVVNLALPQSTQKRSVKRSFGATTMEILKSFPFPGHHSHSHQQHRSC